MYASRYQIREPGFNVPVIHRDSPFPLIGEAAFFPGGATRRMHCGYGADALQSETRRIMPYEPRKVRIPAADKVILLFAAAVEIEPGIYPRKHRSVFPYLRVL